MQQLLSRISHRSCSRKQEQLSGVSNQITHVWMNSKNPDRKLRKSMRVHNSIGELSDTIKFLRLRDNSEQFDYFLREKKKLCGSEFMAYEVKGNSHLKVVLQEWTKRGSIKETGWKEPMKTIF